MDPITITAIVLLSLVFAISAISSIVGHYKAKEHFKAKKEDTNAKDTNAEEAVEAPAEEAMNHEDPANMQIVPAGAIDRNHLLQTFFSNISIRDLDRFMQTYFLNILRRNHTLTSQYIRLQVLSTLRSMSPDQRFELVTRYNRAITAGEEAPVNTIEIVSNDPVVAARSVSILPEVLSPVQAAEVMPDSKQETTSALATFAMAASIMVPFALAEF